MTTSLWHRRRTERFAQLLEEASGVRRHRVRSPHDEELAPLVTLRHQLVKTPAPQIDPEFRTGLRAMLVATAEREGIGATATPEPAPARRTPHSRHATSLFARGPRARTAVVAGVAAGAVAFGMSNASANAVPGDALYGVKRSTERAQLALASSEVGRAQLYLDFARTRLAEAGTVHGGLDRVLDDMDRDTLAGVRLLTSAADNRRDPAALDPIDRFVTDQRETLDELAKQVDGADRARVGSSLALLRTIEERATELRRSLDDQCPSATSVDDFGPLPVTCLSAPAPGALGPAAQPPPAPPQSQPGTGAGPSSGDPRGETNTREAPADSGGNAPSSSSSTDQNTGSTGTTSQPDTEPDTGDETTEPDDDSGLLDGLNRLVGNLLGG